MITDDSDQEHEREPITVTEQRVASNKSGNVPDGQHGNIVKVNDTVVKCTECGKYALTPDGLRKTVCKIPEWRSVGR